MGFLDNVQSSINRGMAGANRSANAMKLKSQLSDAMKRRQALAAQLGASLYDVTKGDPSFRTGREALYDGIAAIDVERAGIQAEIERIEAEAQAAQVAATHFACPFCGTSVGASDLFCSGCGKPMADIQAALAAQQVQVAAPAVAGGPTCPHCGAPINPGDAFCMSCGAKIEAPAEPVVPAAPAVDAEPAHLSDDVAGDAALSDGFQETPAAPADFFDSTPEPVEVPAPAAEPVAAEPAPEGNVCPSCGKVNKPTDKFCMCCGTKLQ